MQCHHCGPFSIKLFIILVLLLLLYCLIVINTLMKRWKRNAEHLIIPQAFSVTMSWTAWDDVQYHAFILQRPKLWFEDMIESPRSNNTCYAKLWCLTVLFVTGITVNWRCSLRYTTRDCGLINLKTVGSFLHQCAKPSFTLLNFIFLFIIDICIWSG